MPVSNFYFGCSPEEFCEYFFRVCLGILHWKMAGILKFFWWIFSGLSLPRNEARKVLEKFGENSEQNPGQNSGRNIEKFGKLSFCNFPDLISFKRHERGFKNLTRSPGLAFCFTGLWTLFGSAARSSHHPCKNGTHSTCLHSTGGHTPRYGDINLKLQSKTPQTRKISKKSPEKGLGSHDSGPRKRKQKKTQSAFPKCLVF